MNAVLTACDFTNGCKIKPAHLKLDHWFRDSETSETFNFYSTWNYSCYHFFSNIITSFSSNALCFPPIYFGFPHFHHCLSPLSPFSPPSSLALVLSKGSLFAGLNGAGPLELQTMGPSSEGSRTLERGTKTLSSRGPSLYLCNSLHRPRKLCVGLHVFKMAGAALWEFYIMDLQRTMVGLTTAIFQESCVFQVLSCIYYCLDFCNSFVITPTPAGCSHADGKPYDHITSVHYADLILISVC